jgi:hypothetical protein
MITVSMFHLLCAQQGGVCMSSRPFSRDVLVTPIQVWPVLSADLRTRIVGLLAQLALNVVAAHSDTVYTTKEAAYAQPTTLPKNPSRPS